MDKEIDHYYKTHIVSHFLANQVYILEVKTFERFIATFNLVNCKDQNKWLESLQSIAKNPKLLQLQNIPSTPDQVAALFSGKDGNKKVILDPQRIFKILKNCTLFPVNEELINKVTAIRNEYSHQPAKHKTPRLTDNLMVEYHDTMLALLNVLKDAGMERGEQLVQMFYEMKVGTFSAAYQKIHNFGTFRPEDYTDLPDDHVPGFIQYLNEVSVSGQENEGAPGQDLLASEHFGEKESSNLSADVRPLRKEDVEDLINKLQKKIAAKGGRVKLKGKKNHVLNVGDNSTVNINIVNYNNTSTGKGTPPWVRDSTGEGDTSSQSGKVKGLKERDPNKPSSECSKKRKAPAAIGTPPWVRDSTGEGDTSSQSVCDGASKKSKKQRNQNTKTKGNELIELADLTCRPEKGRPFQADVRGVKGLKKCEGNNNYTFHMLLGRKGTTIDTRYYGPEKLCKKKYKRFEKMALKETLVEVSNYKAKRKYTKNNKKDFRDGNHPRCRLVFDNGSHFEDVAK